MGSGVPGSTPAASRSGADSSGPSGPNSTPTSSERSAEPPSNSMFSSCAAWIAVPTSGARRAGARNGAFVATYSCVQMRACVFVCVVVKVKIRLHY